MKRRTFHRGKFFAFLLLAALAAGLICLPGGSVSAAPAHACLAAITVTNTNDSGAGSLRQAMADICAGGTITFGSDASITLTSSSLLLKKIMTIDGAGHSVTISGGFALGDFSVNSGVTASLKHLLIANGKAHQGGGIYNEGVLTVQNSTIYGHMAMGDGGGIYNDGTLTVQNSTFFDNSTSANGGGIFNEGTLTAQNSTFSDNMAGFGGGIYNDDTLTVQNSTFSHNSAATGGGGGIYNNLVWDLSNTIIANSNGGDCVDNGDVDT
jgi:hypothetical protein